MGLAAGIDGYKTFFFVTDAAAKISVSVLENSENFFYFNIGIRN
jgi:hypothetical protein